jgi:hypothetical protein
VTWKVKHTFEYVESFFLENGCKLLETEYINNATPMRYICECGDESKITFAKFRDGGRCKKCGIRKSHDSQRLPYDYVKDYFENEGCTLLEEEYINNNTPLKYICVCGDINFITFSCFKEGQRCRKCGRKKMADTQRFKYDDVFKIFKENGCILLSTKYVGANELLDYICSCGNPSKISLSKLMNGRRCNECAKEKRRRHFQLSYEEVEEYFRNRGCILLDGNEYENNRTPLHFICSCGNPSVSSLWGFKRSQGMCNQCALQSRSGENHYRWQGGISELNNFLRSIIQDWRKESFKNGNYKCEISGIDRNLVIHHKYPFNEIVKETIDLLELPIYSSIGEYADDQIQKLVNKFIIVHNGYGLGVVLNKDIHIEFHSKYGKEGFTPGDYERFKKEKMLVGVEN